MLSRESPKKDAWGVEFLSDPRCEWCDCSLIGRFGGVPDSECDSCAADWKRLVSTGKIEIEDA